MSSQQGQVSKVLQGGVYLANRARSLPVQNRVKCSELLLL